MKLIESEKLYDFGVRFLKAYGASDENAGIIISHLVDNELKGIEAQGAMRFFEYARFMESGKVDGKAETVIKELAPGAFLVDGNNGFGIVSLQKATEKMLESLKTNPMSVAGVINCGHTGRVGAFAEEFAQNYCYGCIYGGGGHKTHPSTAPFGGIKGIVSTNPVSLAMPGMDNVPLSADFATSASAGGRIRLAQRKGVPLPPGQVLDRFGNPTTDPVAYFDGGVMLPAAGPKGTGMGLINELLAYGLFGDPNEFNWMMISFDLSVFCPREEYDARAKEYLKKVNEIPPAPGFKSVCYPGQFEARCQTERERVGIDVADNVAEQLIEMAKVKDIAIPDELL